MRPAATPPGRGRSLTGGHRIPVSAFLYPLILAVLPPCFGFAAQMTDRIVAVINTEVITLSELKSEVESEEKRLRQHSQGGDVEKRVHQLQYSALTRMIERKLQIQTAAARGVQITDADVDGAIRDMKRQGEEIDEKDPVRRRAIKDQLLLMRVVEREVRTTITVFEPEIKKYYETHLARFSLPEEYRLSQILLQQRSTDTPELFRSRAQDIYAKLKQGEDFADLAFRFSSGAEAVRGGNLGFVRQGELLPEIERAVTLLKPGEVTTPVETSQGLHIIRLDEKKPSQYRPFGEVRSEIQALVYQEKSEDFYQVWLSDLKNKSYIEIKF